MSRPKTPWIPMHGTLKNNHKLTVICRYILLDPNLIENRVKIAGHLYWFWTSVQDVYPNGIIPNNVPLTVISDMAGYPGDSEKFFEAMVEAGFIDKPSDNSCLCKVHEWELYGGLLERKRDSNRRRQKKFQDKKRGKRVSITGNNALYNTKITHDNGEKSRVEVKESVRKKEVIPDQSTAHTHDFSKFKLPEAAKMVFENCREIDFQKFESNWHRIEFQNENSHGLLNFTADRFSGLPKSSLATFHRMLSEDRNSYLDGKIKLPTEVDSSKPVETEWQKEFRLQTEEEHRYMYAQEMRQRINGLNRIYDEIKDEEERETHATAFLEKSQQICKLEWNSEAAKLLSRYEANTLKHYKECKKQCGVEQYGKSAENGQKQG